MAVKVEKIYLLPARATWWLAFLLLVGAGTARGAETGPMLLSAASLDGRQVGLVFSGPVDLPGATNAAHYSLSGGARVERATRRDDTRSVELAVSGLAGDSFLLAVTNLFGTNGSPVPAATVTGRVQHWSAVDVGSPSPAGRAFSGAAGSLEVRVGGRDIGDAQDEFHFVHVPREGDFDVFTQVRSLVGSNSRSRAGLMARESLDPGSRHLMIGVAPPGRDNAFLAVTRPATGGMTTEWGSRPQPVPYPDAFLRLRRTGNQFSAAWGNSPTNWEPWATLSGDWPARLLVGLATSASASGTGQTAEASFARFGDFTWPEPRVNIVRHPEDVLLDAEGEVTFSVAAEAWSGAHPLPAGELTYQWQRQGINIPSATAPTLTLPRVTREDDGAQFVCVVRLPGTNQPSAPAMLRFSPDRTPPGVVYVSSLQNGNRLLVRFSKPVDPGTATDPGHYTLDRGTITAVTLQADRQTVALTVGGVTGTELKLAVEGVADLAGQVMGAPALLATRIAPSPPVPAGIRGADSVVTFNEIHYHARPGGPGEFIELFNQMDTDIQLDGWRLEGAVRFTFPSNIVLRAGGYQVVAAAPAGFPPGTLGPWTGSLSNGGERLVLLNHNDRQMDEVEWDDEEPWPVAADGSGATLAKRRPRTASGPPENWQASPKPGGSPGASNLPPATEPDGPWINVALRRPVIAGTGSFPNNPFDVGTPGQDFVAQHVTDGSTSDVYGENYWLGREGRWRESFTLDLQEVRRVALLRLRNTRNGDFNDRATAAFEVWASSAVGASNELVNPFRILSGILPPVWGQSPITPEYFDARRGLVVTNARYLRFQTRSSWLGNGNVGLNEFSVLEATLPHASDLRFSEVAAALGDAFWLELANGGTNSLDLAGCAVFSSHQGQFNFPAESLAAGAFLVLDAARLGWTPQPGEKLFLRGPRGEILDGVSLAGRPRARVTPRGPFRNPSEPTPGASNRFRFTRDIVINEILYRHPPDYSPEATVPNREEWIELYHRGRETVDLGGWRLAGPVDFTFPAGTLLAPGAHLVVAGDAEALRRKHPGVRVIGDFAGRLTPGAKLQLLDAADNPAAEVQFFAESPWPEAADGGGSSLELRHPSADPAAPESWGASLERARSPWLHYEFDVVARNPRFAPNLHGYHELRLCLLGSGEALLDNVRVVERPATTARQLVQDPGFDRPAGPWRFLGNHRRSNVVTDGGGRVLHLVATGPGHYLLNHVETTFKSDGAVVPIEEGTSYRVSFDARWLSGSPRLRIEAYYNQFAAQAILARPATIGTPGRRNSTYTDQPGPTFRGLTHSPAIPASGQDIAVRVEAAAPEGIAAMTLRYRPDGGAWQSRPMTLSNQAWRASIPGQPAGTLVQFHVTGEDTRGVVRHGPAGGEDARALVRVADAPTDPDRQSFHLLMTAADTAWLTDRTNILSDDRLGGTVVVNGEEVFYDCRVRLRGSMWSRRDRATTGFNVEFPGGQPFRGIHPDVTIKRPGHREFLLRQLLHQAGGVPNAYDDLVQLLTPVASNRGPGRLSLARYEDRWLESQFPDGKDGPLYLFEGIRELIPQGGGPEDPKPAWPAGFVRAFDLADLGPDPEQYRWSLQLINGRTRDDFGPMMAVARLFDREGPDLETNAPAVLDVDQWLRTMAVATLAGVADVYAQGPDGYGNPHNLAFYARPGDGRMLLLPQDWDAAFGRGVQSQVYPDANLGKLVDRPAVRRAFQGHLLDLVARAFNPGYLAPWVRHFSALTGEDMNPVLDYLQQRADHCLSTLPPPIAFELTTNGGRDFSTNASQLMLEGVGWVDVAAVRLSGEVSALPVTWLDDVRWQAVCPLAAGTNRLALVAYNRAGEPVGFDQLTVTNLRAAPTLRDALRLTELHYHPAPPGAAEVAAGFTDNDDFEFLELLNIGQEPLDLGGAAFVTGITYRFDSRLLPPGGRVVLAKSPAALIVRHGTLGVPVVGGYAGNLSNGGERLVLLDASGRVVLDFAYGDSAQWPAEADGGGASMEVRNLEGNYSDPANWSASLATGGTPGEGPPPGPVALAIGPADDGGRLSFLAAPGQAYTIEYQDRLGDDSWQEWQAIPADWQERRVEVELEPGAAPTRFFRVRGTEARPGR